MSVQHGIWMRDGLNGCAFWSFLLVRAQIINHLISESDPDQALPLDVQIDAHMHDAGPNILLLLFIRVYIALAPF